MSVTYTTQVNLPPSSSNSLNADGEGMHSLFPFDLATGLNNLGTYVNNHWHYVQGSQATTLYTNGSITSSYTGSATEKFVLQVPALIPLWAVRLVWTAGARCIAVSQSNVKVYLSRTPYTGDISSAFDTTQLGTGYGSRSVSVSITAGQYQLATDTSTGITPINDNNSGAISVGVGFKTKRRGYVIVTATGGTNATVGVDDFSFWFLPS